MMNVFGIVKTAVGVTTSIGSGIIISNVTRAFLPPNQKLLSKIATTMATATLGAMLGDTAAKYTDKLFDETKDAILAAKDEIKKDVA